MMYVIYKKDDSTGTSSLITRGVTPDDNETLENLLSLMFDGEDAYELLEMPICDRYSQPCKQEEVNQDDTMEFIDSIINQIKEVSKENSEPEQEVPVRMNLQDMIAKSVMQQEQQQESDTIGSILNEVVELKDSVKTLHAQLIATMRDKALLEEECERLRSERDRIHTVLRDIISRR